MAGREHEGPAAYDAVKIPHRRRCGRRQEFGTGTSFGAASIAEDPLSQQAHVQGDQDPEHHREKPGEAGEVIAGAVAEE